MRLNPLEQMKLAMERAGVTQAALATALGLSSTTVSKYFSGERAMLPETEKRAWAAIRKAAEARANEIDRKADEDKRRVMEPVKAVPA